MTKKNQTKSFSLPSDEKILNAVNLKELTIYYQKLLEIDTLPKGKTKQKLLKKRGKKIEKIIARIIEIYNWKNVELNHIKDGVEVDIMGDYGRDFFIMESKWWKEPIQSGVPLRLSGMIPLYPEAKGMVISQKGLTDNALTVISTLMVQNRIIISLDRNDIEAILNEKINFNYLIDKRQSFARRERAPNKPAISKVIEQFGKEGEFNKYPIPGIKKSHIFIPHPYPIQEKFTGRIAMRTKLTKWLTLDKHPVFIIRAIGGMGKSALSWIWFKHDVFGESLPGFEEETAESECCRLDEDRKPVGAIWWSFYEEKANFTLFLQNTGKKIFANDKDYNELSDRDKLDRIYDFFHSNPFLIIFDGIERALRSYKEFSPSYKKQKSTIERRDRECIDPNLEKFLERMAAEGGLSKLLMTTRVTPLILDGLGGVKEEVLERMEKEEAVNFFRKYDVKNIRSEIEGLCKGVNYIPLCLRILAGALSTNPKYNIDVTKLSEDVDLAKIAKQKHDKNKINHILEFSERFISEKNEQLKDLMCLISAFRTKVPYNALKVVTEDEELEDLSENLNGLIDRGLLFYDPILVSYEMHPEVKDYYYDIIENKVEIHQKLRKYFASVPEPEKIETIDDLEPVIELYHHTVKAGMHKEALILFYDKLHDHFHYKFGAYLLTIELLTEYVEQFEYIEDIKYSELFEDLTRAFSIIGKLRDSLKWSLRAIDICEKSKDKQRLAEILIYLAWSQIALGDFEQALNSLDRSYNMSQKSGMRYFSGLALQDKARILMYKGMTKKVIDLFKQASDIFNKITKNPNKDYRKGRIEWEPDKVERYAQRRLFFENLRMAELALNLGNKEKALENGKMAFEKMKNMELFQRDEVRMNWIIGSSHITYAIKCSSNESRSHVKEAEKYLETGYKYIIKKNSESKERICKGALRDCRSINLVELEAAILLETAKLRHLQARSPDSRPATRDSRLKESFTLVSEAFEIANRCGYVLQQADIHLFLAHYYKDLDHLAKAKEHAEFAKLRSHQMIDVETGDYITKLEETEYKYKPCYDKAVKLLKELEEK